MTKDVLVSISGMHMDVMAEPAREMQDAIEIVIPGSYYWRSGKHYIVYDQAIEGSAEKIRNTIKITGTGSMEIIKSGMTSAHMVFEEGRRNYTYYRTPYGQMLVGVNTKKMDVSVEDETIKICVDYELDINHEPLADCEIRMSVVQKENGDFSMFD